MAVAEGIEVVEEEEEDDDDGLWDAGGRATIVPANSEPEIQGRGGWCWYLPRIWSRSKKFVAVAWMAIVYWFGCGIGSGRVETWRSRGP